MRVAILLAEILFVLLLPLTLVSSNLRYVVNDPNTYANGFAKYGVAATTGIAESELLRGAAGLREYFNSDQEPISVQVEKDGRTVDLFRTREVAHLRDVKGLIRLFYRGQVTSLTYMICFVAVAIAFERGSGLRRIARLALWGCGLTLGILVLVALLSVTDFDALFLRFHLISFSNDLWMLDPREDNLIMMFPQGFFYDTTLRLVILTLVEAILVSTASVGFLIASRRKRRKGVGVAH